MTGITFTEMQQFVQREADRIETVQGDLVATGMLKAPHPGKLRDKEICEAIVRLIDELRGDQVIMDRLAEWAAQRRAAEKSTKERAR